MPAAIAATTPVAVTTVATLVLPLIQRPPVVELLSVAVAPGQILVVPVIAAGSGLTVTTAVRKQPVAAT